MKDTKILICPCGEWHSIAINVTEDYEETFTCGLVVKAHPCVWDMADGSKVPSGWAEFQSDDGEVTCDGMATDGKRVYMFLIRVTST